MILQDSENLLVRRPLRTDRNVEKLHLPFVAFEKLVEYLVLELLESGTIDQCSETDLGEWRTRTSFGGRTPAHYFDAGRSSWH